MQVKVKSLVFALCSLFFATMQAQEQELLDYPLDTINGEEVYRYEVERSVGLYRIGVNFNVPQSEIIRLNPQLRDRGLHFGELLYIPTGRPVVQETPRAPREPRIQKPVIVPQSEAVPVKPEPVEPELSTPEPQQSVVAESIVADSLVADTMAQDSVDNRPIVELALMLPFESHQARRSANAERMFEFYQGALLALYDLQNDSVKYRLRVYDTERSELRVNALCDSNELDSVRGILGLVYPIQIERMATWSETHQVPILLPFNDNTDLSSHTQLMQFNSTDLQEADSLCQWIAGQNGSVHCVMVEVQESEVANSIRTLRQQLRAHEIPYSTMALRDLMADSVAYALDSTRENLIILHSDRYQNARILIPHLAKLQNAGFRIRIVGQYSWQKENITLPQVYTSIFAANTRRDAYERLWATYFGSEHVSETPRYDLLGYDLMRALVARINGQQASNGLLTDIRWTQVDEGGWQNANVRIVTTTVFP
ncbi:MAG: hypothetical protein II644_06770 [Paludibacteraceae bacterium]|nr:hypothetical protein [Paludibacteraceae bacterium]